MMRRKFLHTAEGDGATNNMMKEVCSATSRIMMEVGGATSRKVRGTTKSNELYRVIFTSVVMYIS